MRHVKVFGLNPMEWALGLPIARRD